MGVVLGTMEDRTALVEAVAVELVIEWISCQPSQVEVTWIGLRHSLLLQEEETEIARMPSQLLLAEESST